MREDLRIAFILPCTQNNDIVFALCFTSQATNSLPFLTGPVQNRTVQTKRYVNLSMSVYQLHSCVSSDYTMSKM